MNKDQIKKKYNLKVKELIKHNRLYYDKSKPIITDAKYDDLKKEIIDLEIKYEYLKNINSPKLKVGFEPSKLFQKFKHKMPMLSLSLSLIHI